MDSELEVSTKTKSHVLQLDKSTITGAIKSYIGSAKYLKRIVPMSVFWIINHRVDYDPKYYDKTTFKGCTFVVPERNTTHKQLNRLFRWAYQAMEALEKGYLDQMLVRITFDGKTEEYYRYSFKYFEDSRDVIKPTGGTAEILKLTKQWFDTLGELGELKKLPETAELELEVCLKGAPNSYTLESFRDTENSFLQSNMKKSGLMVLGGLHTNFHQVKVYCKFEKASSIENEDVVTNEAYQDCEETINIVEEEDEPSIAKVEIFASKSTIPDGLILNGNDRISSKPSTSKRIDKKRKLSENKENTAEKFSEDSTTLAKKPKTFGLGKSEKKRTEDSTKLPETESTDALVLKPEKDDVVDVDDDSSESSDTWNPIECPCELPLRLPHIEMVKCVECENWQHCSCLGLRRATQVLEQHKCLKCNIVQDKNTAVYGINPKMPQHNIRTFARLRTAMLLSDLGQGEPQVVLRKHFTRKECNELDAWLLESEVIKKVANKYVLQEEHFKKTMLQLLKE